MTSLCYPTFPGLSDGKDVVNSIKAYGSIIVPSGSISDASDLAKDVLPRPLSSE
jgi:hypothetical protein